MANYANAKATIAANIYTNHTGQVTAEMVKTAADAIVDTLIAGGYLYAGVAKLTPTQTNPGSPDANVFYIATEPGTYTNFVGAGRSLVVAEGEVAIFKFNGTWSKEVTGAATAAQVNQLGQQVIYDVTMNNPTAGPNNDGKWESLSALLSDANLSTLIPTSVRCGGMSIRFVQTSDNKYVQWRLKSQNFNTNVNNWVNDEVIITNNVVYINNKPVCNIAGYDFMERVKDIVAKSTKSFSAIDNTPFDGSHWHENDYTVEKGKYYLLEIKGNASGNVNPYIVARILNTNVFGVFPESYTSVPTYEYIKTDSFTGKFIWFKATDSGTCSVWTRLTSGSEIAINVYKLDDWMFNDLTESYLSYEQHRKQQGLTYYITGTSINCYANEITLDGCFIYRYFSDGTYGRQKIKSGNYKFTSTDAVLVLNDENVDSTEIFEGHPLLVPAFVSQGIRSNNNSNNYVIAVYANRSVKCLFQNITSKISELPILNSYGFFDENLKELLYFEVGAIANDGTDSPNASDKVLRSQRVYVPKGKYLVTNSSNNYKIIVNKGQQGTDNIIVNPFDEYLIEANDMFVLRIGIMRTDDAAINVSESSNASYYIKMLPNSVVEKDAVIKNFELSYPNLKRLVTCDDSRVVIGNYYNGLKISTNETEIFDVNFGVVGEPEESGSFEICFNSVANQNSSTMLYNGIFGLYAVLEDNSEVFISNGYSLGGYKYWTFNRQELPKYFSVNTPIKISWSGNNIVLSMFNGVDKEERTYNGKLKHIYIKATVYKRLDLVIRYINTTGYSIKRAVSSVGFGPSYPALSIGNKLYVAYYNSGVYDGAERDMALVLEKIDLINGAIEKKVYSNIITPLDSHNHIDMAADDNGRLHIMCNCHASHLYYLYGNPASSLNNVVESDNLEEQEATYPQFIKLNGHLYATYRELTSINGKWRFFIWDETNETYTPTTNVYVADGTIQYEGHTACPYLERWNVIDGYAYCSFCWRTTYDASSNTDISFIKTTDFVHFYNFKNEEVTLPITLANYKQTVKVRDISPNSGILNQWGIHASHIGNKDFIYYFKFDDKGSNVYVVSWDIAYNITERRITGFLDRFNLDNPTEGSVLVFLKENMSINKDFIEISYFHKYSGQNTFYIDSNLDIYIGKIKEYLKVGLETFPRASDSEITTLLKTHENHSLDTNDAALLVI